MEIVRYGNSEIMVEVQMDGVYLTKIDSQEEQHSYLSLDIWEEPRRENIVLVDNTHCHFEPLSEGFTLAFFINSYSKMFHLWCSKENLTCYLLKRITIENGIENVINLEGEGFLLERKNGFGVHFSNDFSSQKEILIKKDMKLANNQIQIMYFHGNWYGLIDSSALYICSLIVGKYEDTWYISPKSLIMRYNVTDGGLKMHRTTSSLFFIETEEYSPFQVVSLILKEKPSNLTRSSFFLYLMKDRILNPIQISEWNDYMIIANESRLILFQDPPEDKDGLIVPDFKTNKHLNYHQETFFNRSIEGLNEERIIWVLPTKNTIDDLIILTGGTDPRSSRTTVTKRKLFAGNPKLECYSNDYSKLQASNLTIELYYANRTIIKYNFTFSKPSTFDSKLVVLIIFIFVLFVILLLLALVKLQQITKLEEEVSKNLRLLQEKQEGYECDSLNSSYSFYIPSNRRSPSIVGSEVRDGVVEL